MCHLEKKACIKNVRKMKCYSLNKRMLKTLTAFGRGEGSQKGQHRVFIANSNIYADQWLYMISYA